MYEPAALILMFVVFPVWVAAGLADWYSHRRTFIAQTSGLKENMFHWVMFAEISVGIVAVAVLEVNAAVLLLVFAIFVVHQLTVYQDLDYSTLLRDVGPFEQMVHSFLELLPLVALALLAMIAWPQAQALVGMGQEAADWTLRRKTDPLPDEYLAVALLMVLLFNLLPLVQETWACVAAPRKVRMARPGTATHEKVEPKL
jgi:hypothetical protein